MKTRLWIYIALSFSIVFASLIYVVTSDTGTTVVQKDVKEPTVQKDVKGKTAYLQEVQKEFGSHPVYLEMKKKFPDMSNRVQREDASMIYLEATTASDANMRNLTLYIYKNLDDEKRYASIIFCNVGNSSVDELQDVDEVVIDYIKNTHCFDLEQDPDKLYFVPASSQSTNDDVEFLFERHSAYLAMKERYPDSVDEISRPADSANVGVDVDAINPENSNELKLRIYSSPEGVINDT